MTSKTKKIIVVSVLSIGIIASIVYFIFKTGTSNNSLFKVSNQQENDYRLGFSPETNQFLGILDKKVNTDNYTDNFINRFGFEIASQNLNGPQNGNITIPAETAFTETLAREFGKSISVPQVSEKDIRITKEDNKQTIIEYLKNLNQILTQANKTNVTINTISEKNISEIGKNANALHIVTTNLLALEVPLSWATFHTQTINLYQKKAILLDVLASLNDDPVKALVAIREFQSLTQEETQLSSLLSEKINQIKS